MAQKISMDLAGQFVRAHGNAIKLFLHEVTESQPVITPRFVLALLRGVEDTWTGPAWMPVDLHGYGTEAEVIDCISAEVKKVGSSCDTRGGNSQRRVISGPWSAVVSIPETYRLLKLRAEAAGFIVDGYRIFKIAKDEAEAEAEG